MNLIAIVLALLLERILSHSPTWRAHDLTGHWMRWLDGVIGARSWSLALYLLPPVSLVALVDHWLFGQPLGALLQLPLSILVLVACLGPRDLSEQVHAYERLRDEGRAREAEALLDDLMNGPHRDAGPRPQSGRSAVAACFVQGHERWFAVLFWFFLLGPAGAVAYRVLGSVAWHLRHEGYGEDSLKLAEWLHGAMAWPSARIAALCFALAGSADEAFSRWRSWVLSQGASWTQDSWPLLANMGLAAMQQDPSDPHTEPECLETALQLLGRSLMLLLAFLALLTIGGWLS